MTSNHDENTTSDGQSPRRKTRRPPQKKRRVKKDAAPNNGPPNRTDRKRPERRAVPATADVLTDDEVARIREQVRAMPPLTPDQVTDICNVMLTHRRRDET